MKKTNIHLAYRIIMTQVLVVFVASFITLGFQDVQKAYSVLLGGGACIVPSFYFARHFLYSSIARSPRRILISFFQGEMIKFVLTVFLFWLMMRYLPVSFLSLFVGYFSAQAGFWVSPFFLSRRQIKIL